MIKGPFHYQMKKKADLSSPEKENETSLEQIPKTGQHPPAMNLTSFCYGGSSLSYETADWLLH